MASAAPLPDLPVPVADGRAAARRIEGAVVHTPTNPSRTLSKLTGANLWLKFENLQFTASYKERGALNNFCSPTPGRSTQLFGAFLGEPRTFGLSIRGKM